MLVVVVVVVVAMLLPWSRGVRGWYRVIRGDRGAGETSSGLYVCVCVCVCKGEGCSALWSGTNRTASKLFRAKSALAEFDPRDSLRSPRHPRRYSSTITATRPNYRGDSLPGDVLLTSCPITSVSIPSSPLAYLFTGNNMFPCNFYLLIILERWNLLNRIEILWVG